jgi:nicotinamide-nucleotide amidase
MNVEVIAIGDELLLGQTINTNAAWLGLELAKVGGSVVRSSVLADSSEAIVSALENVLKDTDLVVLTGGLGPTKDDLTKKVLTDYFGGALVYQPSVFAHIEDLFKTLGRVPSEGNREQAFLPNNATLLHNT